MSGTAIKRILNRDIKSIQKNKLNEMGIYIEFDEDNMLSAKAMILGPKDSIYAGGIFLFSIKFPTNYPYAPPQVNYISRGSIRIHPNLYTGSSKDNYLGKVCLSILGTWSGPQWTTIMDISSVLISIQSLLDENPLDHEPGFSGKETQAHINYKRCVEYETIRTLILKNGFDLPEPYNCFSDVIQSHMQSLKSKLHNFLEDRVNSTYNNKIMVMPMYNIRLPLDYEFLKTRMETLFKI